MLLCIYMEYKKKILMNDRNKQKQTQRKQTSGYQWEKEGNSLRLE